MATIRLPPDFKEFLKLLKEHNVRYLLIGGYAVGFHGYPLEQEKDKVKAKEYAETALKLAHCDDGPPYYYEVAYEEAQRMLERMKAEGLS